MRGRASTQQHTVLALLAFITFCYVYSTQAIAGLSGEARTVIHSALLSEQVSEARGTVMSVLSSLTAGSAALGASVGGMFIDRAGFWLFGLFCLTASLSAAA